MQFYMTPGSCSTGIHILLEELGCVFQVNLVNLLAGDQHSAAYRAINPKGTIPTLVRDDGSALTDFQAIAWWLALSRPRKGLLPTDAEGQARTLESMNHSVGTLHGQGFARIFTADRFADDAAGQEAAKQRGREILEEGFRVASTDLGDKPYLLGDFSIADAALFYVEFWATRSDVVLPANCLAHYQRMVSRPAVRQVLAEEGYRV